MILISFNFRKNNHFYEKVGKKCEEVCIDDEIPFDIPDSWEWCRLGLIGDWKSGSTPKRGESKYYENGTIPWLKTGDLNNGIITEIPEFITEIALEETSVRLNPIGSVLIAMYGATIGKVGILDIEATTNQACCACIPFNGIFNKFLFYYLMSQNKKFNDMGEGGAQPNISRTKIVNYLFPLPPLKEQQRIVKQIEILMPFIYEYKKLNNKLKELNNNFSNKIKDSILQEAIQGKLVSQDPNDEPASVLLERIRAEKERLIKEKKIKRNKKESFIFKENNHFYEKIGKNEPICIDDEIPFTIPNSWQWCRLGDLVYNFGQKKPDQTFSYVDVGSIDNKNLKLNDEETILTKEEAPSRARKIIKEGAVIYSTVRPYLLNMSIIDKKFYYEPIASTAFAILNPFEGLYNKYLFYYLQSPTFINYVNSVMSGVAYPAINDKKLYNSLISLPPFEEQKQIVKKIEKIIKY